MLTSAALLLALPFLVVPQGDPAKDLKSKDFDVRKAAVLALTENPTEDAGKLLSKALKDEDWEIAELAATGLGSLGSNAGSAATKALVGLALEGPIYRLRREAALALAKIDSDQAITELSKKLSGKMSGPASEAIVALGAPEEPRNAPKSLKKAASKGKEYEQRRSAAMALLIVGAKDRAENLEKLFEHEEIGVHSAALDAIRIAPNAADLDPVREFLLREDLANVNERRGIWALRAILWINEDESTRQATAVTIRDALLASSSEAVQRRAPRFLEALLNPPQDSYGQFTLGKDEQFSRDWVLEELAPALEHDSAAVRAAAVHALGVTGTTDSLARAREIGSDDADAHVRRTALAAALKPNLEEDEDDEDDDKDKMRYDPATAEWLLKRIGSETDGLTAEDLCVALGVKNFKRAIPPLMSATESENTWVAVCAAVSLGKTRLPESVPPLVKLLSHEDWRIRGAAVVGLGQSWQKDSIEHLINSVADTEPSVSRAAHDFLKAFSGRKDTLQTKTAWELWWEEKNKSINLIDPETADERSKKYGYSTNWDQIYGGLDIVVLESRGDHIQNILEKLGVQHRLTQAAQIAQSSIHPQAVYVSNCTGEIESPDVDHLTWFLRTGGYMFGSCWSLHETIEKVYPGVVRKYQTIGEVLDDVSAANCAQGSNYLQGVFSKGVQPVYHLEGAHLIEVLDAERAEVLIDSPDCAERWGAGDLAVWFPAGHGIVLDSVNHFEEQGFKHAKGLKKPAQLQAYAVDHLGLSYADLRSSRDEKYWKSASKAANEVLDLSVFKLITNFVRLKRLHGR